jgi:hypothetical protein
MGMVKVKVRGDLTIQELGRSGQGCQGGLVRRLPTPVRYYLASYSTTSLKNTSPFLDLTFRIPTLLPYNLSRRLDNMDNVKEFADVPQEFGMA